MIQFRFDNLADLWAMSGHGPYVWASYAITIVALIFLVIYPLYQQKKFLREEAARERRMQHVQQGSSHDSSTV